MATSTIKPGPFAGRHTVPAKIQVKKAGLALWMERVLDECDHAGADLSPDPVHDLRVALRRCRSIADGVMAVDPDRTWKQTKKAGRNLFRSLGTLRDLHVMEEWVGLLGAADDPVTAALRQHLKDKEMQCKQEALKAGTAFDRKQWRKWESVLPRRLARLRTRSAVFEHLALELWTQAHELHRSALRNRSKTSFHNLRIGLKRFRYIVENFLPEQHAVWSDDLKELQDWLGEVHDLDVLWETALQLNSFPTAESRSWWHSRIIEERSRRIEKYRSKMVGKNSLWQVWRADLPKGEEIRAAALSRLKLWGAALDPDAKHSLHVVKLALQLYDSAPHSARRLSDPVRDDRGILQLAAMLHAVGRSKRKSKSHKVTYKLIEQLIPPLGWSAEELHLVAVISRYYRGALPQSKHSAMQGLTPAQRWIVLRLAGILWLAEAFDSDHAGTIQHLRIEEKQDFLVVFARGYDPRSPLAEKIAAGRHLLETVNKIPVQVKAERAKDQGFGGRAIRKSSP